MKRPHHTTSFFSASGFLCGMCLVLALAISIPAAHAEEKEKGKGKKTEESQAFFQSGPVPSLKIEVGPDGVKHLKEQPKEYVRCKITEEGGTVYQDVGIKLKGSAGSFQEFDQRPAFTVNMDKFTPDQAFHGLDKLHLNNSVQDETLLHELICSDLFRKAGIPAPRISHARVWLNGKDMGLYVLKEGVDKTFLKRNFENPKGNLYDGGFCQEVDGDLQRDEGKGEDDHKDLAALADACKLENREERWPRIEACLNVDVFITFMAMELMTGHWDGYCLNRNNYRMYFDPGDGNRAHFLPHGMDQMFGDAGASILNAPVGLVASSVMQNPAWRAKYRERIKTLLPLFGPVEPLAKLVAGAEVRLRPVLEAMGGETLKTHEDRVRDLLERLTARAENLRQQSESPEPKPLEFNDKGVAKVEGWTERHEAGECGHEDIGTEGKQPHQLRIECTGEEPAVGSWRTSVLLAPGKYAFKGRARTKDLKPSADEKGKGAGLRISGASRTNQISGTSKWTELSFDFTVENEGMIELVVEVRATKGEVWFDADSLRLVRAAEGK